MEKYSKDSISKCIGDLSTSERHRLLANDRRWLALEILTGASPPVDLETLAAEVAAQETGDSTVDKQTINKVVISLHHVHLSVMDETGVLDYERETHQIDFRK